MKAAKEASAALLAGESVGFYSEFPWDGELPEGLVLCGKAGRPSAAADPEKGEIAGEAPETGIAVTIHRGCLPFKIQSMWCRPLQFWEWAAAGERMQPPSGRRQRNV